MREFVSHLRHPIFYFKRSACGRDARHLFYGTKYVDCKRCIETKAFTIRAETEEQRAFNG